MVRKRRSIVLSCSTRRGGGQAPKPRPPALDWFIQASSAAVKIKPFLCRPLSPSRVNATSSSCFGMQEGRARKREYCSRGLFQGLKVRVVAPHCGASTVWLAYLADDKERASERARSRNCPLAGRARSTWPRRGFLPSSPSPSPSCSSSSCRAGAGVHAHESGTISGANKSIKQGLTTGI